MDYCRGPEGSGWECGRSVFLGVVSLVSWLLCIAAFYRIVRAHVLRRSFALNIVMLSLTLLQLALDWIELLFKRESRLQLMSITVRALQTNLACSAYGSFVLESRQWDAKQVRQVIYPFSFLTFSFTLILFILSCLDDQFSCEHPLWLVMSVFQLTISILFVLVGYQATRASVVRSYDSYLTDRVEIQKKQRNLWVLITCFVLASVAQVARDAWRLNVFQRTGACGFKGKVIEELLHAVVFSASFHIPAWGVLFVFYYLQRHSFDPSYDLNILQADVQLLETTEQDEEDQHPEISEDSFAIRDRLLRSFSSGELMPL